MKFCGFCGTELRDEYRFCVGCGKSVEATGEQMQAEPTEQVQASVAVPYEATYVPQQQYAQSNYVPAKPVPWFKYSISGFVFSYVALYFAMCCMFPILGVLVFLPAFIVFTALGKGKARKHIKLGNKINGFVIAARVLSTIAIPVGCVCTLLGFIIMMGA